MKRLPLHETEKFLPVKVQPKKSIFANKVLFVKPCTAITLSTTIDRKAGYNIIQLGPITIYSTKAVTRHFYITNMPIVPSSLVVPLLVATL
jgi:hypothetical protein